MLAAWDARADTGSRGAVLWREYWPRLAGAGVPWTIAYDPADPVGTPHGIDGADPKVLTALTGAVEDLRRRASRSTSRSATCRPSRAARADPDPRLQRGRGLLQHHLHRARRPRAATTRSPAPRSSWPRRSTQRHGARRGHALVLAVREPAVAALRRPDAAVLAEAVAADAVHRAADPQRPGVRADGGDRARMSDEARGVALVVAAVTSLQFGAGVRRHAVRRSRPSRRGLPAAVDRRRGAAGDLAPRAARRRRPTCGSPSVFGHHARADELCDLRGDGPDPARHRRDDRVRRAARASPSPLSRRAARPRSGWRWRPPASSCWRTRRRRLTSTRRRRLRAPGRPPLWAAYIAALRPRRPRFPGGSGLAIAMVLGATPADGIPRIATTRRAARPELLAAGAAVAIASSVLPYSLELERSARSPRAPSAS